MIVIDHGRWEIYDPETLPAELRGQKIMFCRRASDGADWYQFQRSNHSDNIWVTIDGEDTVQATHRDVSMLFPGGMRVLEITLDAGDGDLTHESLRQRVYNGRGAFMPARPLIDTTKIAFLRVLAEYGLGEDDLRQLARIAKE